MRLNVPAKLKEIKQNARSELPKLICQVQRTLYGR